MSSGKYLVETRAINKYFGENHVLRDIDFTAVPGKIIAIIGRSGCGKTTFLRCLNCLEFIDSGKIIIGETEIQGQDSLARNGNPPHRVKATSRFENNPDVKKKVLEIRRLTGMVFQQLNLFPHLDVMQNVTLAPKIVGGQSEDISRSKAVALLEKVGMRAYTSRFPHELSGGQMQRVAIARALAMDPELMLYDEPTSALDPELVDDFIDLLKSLNTGGMSSIIVTHSMKLAKNAADLVIYMEDGLFIESGSPAQIFNEPRDERTKNYLGKVLV